MCFGGEIGESKNSFYKYVAIETILRIKPRKLVFGFLVGIKKIRVSVFLEIQPLRGWNKGWNVFWKYVAMKPILKPELQKFEVWFFVGIKRIRVLVFLEIETLRGWNKGWDVFLKIRCYETRNTKIGIWILECN